MLTYRTLSLVNSFPNRYIDAFSFGFLFIVNSKHIIPYFLSEAHGNDDDADDDGDGDDDDECLVYDAP